MIVSSKIRNTALLVSQYTAIYYYLDPKILLCTLLHCSHTHIINHVLSLVEKRKRRLTLSTMNIGRFIMFSAITNIYNKKTKGPTSMELFKATGKLKKGFLTTRDV